MTSVIWLGISAVVSGPGHSASAWRAPPEPSTFISENPASRSFAAMVSLPAQRSSHPSAMVAR
jgi:hypothetical protein